MKRFLHVSIVIVLIALTNVSVASDKIYWTADGNIQRSDLDGMALENIITGLSQPEDVAVDLEAGKIYWTDLATLKIQRANIDGSSIENIVTDVESFSIAIDADAGNIYWTDYSEDKVQRANLNGSGVELLYDGVNQAAAIVLDIYHGRMYWVDDLAGTIKRANLDGSMVEDVVTGIFAPKGIAVDNCAGKIYWAEGLLDSSIYSADIDGTNAVKLVSTYALDIALDLFDGKIIWTNDLLDKIQRCDLDGANLEDITLTANSPKGIDLVMQNNSMPGDFNLDCGVDLADFAVFSDAWNSIDGEDSWNPDCDIADPYGVIDISDLSLFAQQWLE